MSILTSNIHFFEPQNANDNIHDFMSKEYALQELINDLTPVLDLYIDQLHETKEIEDLIDSIQRVFVFLNKQIKYN